MNNFKHILFASLLMASLSATAQETYQDSKLAENQLTGTARYIGMGGAMEALGADISTISTNPAGIGLFRKSQVSVSAGVIAQGGAENYTSLSGNRIDFNGKKSHPTFDQIGIVWSPKLKGNSFINLAFNYHKSADFGQILNATNSLKTYDENGKERFASQNKLAAAKYAWIKGNNFSQDEANVLWSSVDDGYLTAFGANEDASQMNYLNSDLFLYGQYQHGYIGEYDFNVSGSLNNRVWLGLTIGLHDVHYNSNSFYSENLENGAIADSKEQVKIDGTGFDVKAGVIFRPVEDSPFRIGAYFNTPVFYDLTTHNDNDMKLYYAQANAQETYPDIKPAASDYDFRLNTAWKAGFSLGHTIGNNFALGATYEYAWYDHMDNRIKDSGYYDVYYDSYYESSSSDEEMNANTRRTLKGVSTLKVGLEYKPISMLSLRLGYNYASAMFDENGYRDMTIYSPGVAYATSTDYTNWKSTNRFTCGIGFNYQNLFIDLAYQYSMQKGEFYPFMSYVDNTSSEYDCVPPVTEVNNKRHQLLMTVGYRF